MKHLNIPHHLAIIMDGNGRWGLRQKKTRIAGHQQGAEIAKEISFAAVQCGIKILTLFAFSSENRQRPREETQALSLLMKQMIHKEQETVEKLTEQCVRFRFIGELSFFNKATRETFSKLEEKTKDLDGMQLNIAVNYGGRWDIAHALRQILQKSPPAVTSDEEPEEKQLIQQISTCMLAPDVDLLIRTGGEKRISNFLLWQSAYAELYFSDTLWPDFSTQELDEIIHWFANRERRFGHVRT